jgi:hypothetical protein
MKYLEWFLNLFFSKKAKQVKHEAFLEQTKAVSDYKKAQEANKKYLSKYSGRKRYLKA